MSELEQPRRLTLSRIVEMLLTRATREHSAVSISRSTSGVIALDVTVRTGDDETVASVEDAERKACEVFERLRASYPEPNGHDAAEVAFTRNAKGDTQVTVSAKTTGHGEATLPALVQYVQTVYDSARMRYVIEHGDEATPKRRAFSKAPDDGGQA